MPTPTHVTIPTVSPRERALVVTVEESIFAAKPDILPVLDTLYRDCDKELFAGDYRQQFDDYKYKGPAGESGMLFVKTKTALERNTAWRTDEITRPEQWPPVLEIMEFGEEWGLPNSRQTIDAAGNEALLISPSYTVIWAMQEGGSFDTKVTIQHYLSEIPWPDTVVINDEPRPLAINWDLPGNHGTTGPCLHREQKVPAPTQFLSKSDVELQNHASTGGQEILFEPTNHEQWQDYTITRIEYVDGQYYRKDFTYHAPEFYPVATIMSK